MTADTQLQHYKAIVFDFDGVIVDSEAYKIQTFRSLFTDYPDKLEEIDNYNREMRGVNRRPKFVHAYKHILKQPYTHEVIEQLADEYSRRLMQHFIEIPLVEGVRSFLEQTAYPKFIASGAERAEIEQVLKHHNLADYFEDIYDRTTAKPEAINDIVNRLQLQQKEVLFIGDALTDLAAAQESGVDFIARSSSETLFPSDIRRISTFS